jgi:hypothetical protein
MTPSETALLLSAAAAIDSRIITEVTVREWARALEDLKYDDCLEALRRFRRSATTEYLTPGHIRAHVRIIIDDRQLRAATERGLPRPTPKTPLAERLAAAKAGLRKSESA